MSDEVRNLAMRAAEAAKNTATLIEETVKKIKIGAELVNTTSTIFDEVTSATEKVGDVVAKITSATNEQARGIEQVNISVAEVDRVTQQNAANAEESASASEEMSAQADQMKAYVAELVTMVGNTGSKNHKLKGKNRNTEDTKYIELVATEELPEEKESATSGEKKDIAKNMLVIDTDKLEDF